MQLYKTMKPRACAVHGSKLIRTTIYTGLLTTIYSPIDSMNYMNERKREWMNERKPHSGQWVLGISTGRNDHYIYHVPAYSWITRPTLLFIHFYACKCLVGCRWRDDVTLTINDVDRILVINGLNLTRPSAYLYVTRVAAHQSCRWTTGKGTLLNQNVGVTACSQPCVAMLLAAVGLHFPTRFIILQVTVMLLCVGILPDLQSGVAAFNSRH